MSARGASVVDALRDYGYLSRDELEVIAHSPELERAWKAQLAGDPEKAKAAFEAAIGSSSEAVVAAAQVALVQVSAVGADQVIATCHQLAERFHTSPQATVRAAAIHALIVASQQPGAGVEALRDAARVVDDDPELEVSAADAHLEIARWWCRQRAGEQGNTQEADAFADRAIAEYDAVITRAAEANEPALQIIVQLARNGKTELLADMLAWPDDMASAEQATATPVGPEAPALLRAAVARAWLTRGRLLFERSDTTKDAAEAFSELGRRFGNDPAPLVQGIVRQAHELEATARHTHRRSRYGFTWFDPHADIRLWIPFRGHYERRVWGWRALLAVGPVVVIMALLGLWPVSRRTLETLSDFKDARENALDTASTAVFVVTATAMALGWLVMNARSLLGGESARWRQLGGSLILALALAGLIFAGGRITGLIG